MRSILDDLIILGLLLPMGSAVAGLGLVITIHAAALCFMHINVCREFGVVVPWIIASALFAISVGVAWTQGLRESR